MGQAIEEIAADQIVSRIGRKGFDLGDAEVAIEFTTPEVCPENLMRCFEAKIPVVCGTTGWLDRWEEIVAYCKLRQGTLLYASNFSIGVNMFFEVNRRLGQLAKKFDYKVSIDETHHAGKKDRPSGTALTIASLYTPEPQIVSRRIGDLIGNHYVTCESESDLISLTHVSRNRKGFAEGALLAARFLHLRGKPGIYSMSDVMENPPPPFTKKNEIIYRYIDSTEEDYWYCLTYSLGDTVESVSEKWLSQHPGCEIISIKVGIY